MEFFERIKRMVGENMLKGRKVFILSTIRDLFFFHWNSSCITYDNRPFKCNTAFICITHCRCRIRKATYGLKYFRFLLIPRITEIFWIKIFIEFPFCIFKVVLVLSLKIRKHAYVATKKIKHFTGSNASLLQSQTFHKELRYIFFFNRREIS